MIKIGTEYNYLRATPEGEVKQGVGVVKALFLDPRNRLMVSIIDIKDFKTWNVDFIAVDYDEKTLKAYQKLITDVVAVSNEGNELIKKTNEAYSAKVEKLYSDVLGAPVDIPEAPAEQPEEATTH